MLWIILLALSATVDSWAVGMTYKAQKIKIPLAAKGMISLVSGMTALIAVLFGRLLSEILPIAAIQASGGTLLAVMGVKALWQIKKEKEKTNYDLDLSQKIETWEAVWIRQSVTSFSPICCPRIPFWWESDWYNMEIRLMLFLLW